MIFFIQRMIQDFHLNLLILYLYFLSPMPNILALKDINIINSFLYHTKHTQQPLYNNTKTVINYTVTKNRLRANAVPSVLWVYSTREKSNHQFTKTFSNSPECVLPYCLGSAIRNHCFKSKPCFPKIIYIIYLNGSKVSYTQSSKKSRFYPYPLLSTRVTLIFYCFLSPIGNV